MKDITQFNHWGFAEWVEEACKNQQYEILNVRVNYDEDEQCYFVDLHNEHDLDEFNVLETFYYMDLPEIQHDVAEAVKQFPIFINLIQKKQG